MLVNDMPNTQFCGTTYGKTMLCPPVDVTPKVSAWPAIPASDCQLAPQFLLMGTRLVLAPWTQALATEPLPATLEMSTSS